jgi:hypothetical protein
MRDVESPFSVFSASSFTFLVLLGLGFSLSLVANGAEVEAGHTTVRCGGRGDDVHASHRSGFAVPLSPSSRSRSEACGDAVR